jgi:hypothetical protein
VSRRRQLVQSRYRQLRAFELAEESRCRRAAAEAARRERLALDDIALLTRSRRVGRVKSEA